MPCPPNSDGNGREAGRHRSVLSSQTASRMQLRVKPKEAWGDTVAQQHQASSAAVWKSRLQPLGTNQLNAEDTPKIWSAPNPPSCQSSDCLREMLSATSGLHADGSSKPAFKEHPNNNWAWSCKGFNKKKNLPDLRAPCLMETYLGRDRKKSCPYWHNMLFFSPKSPSSHDHLYSSTNRDEAGENRVKDWQNSRRGHSVSLRGHTNSRTI